MVEATGEEAQNAGAEKNTPIDYEGNSPNKKRPKKSMKDLSFASLYSAAVRELIEKQEWQKAMRFVGTSKL